jgi:N-acetylglutamate synthase-like GNAT family acetyltransferase
MTDQPAVRTTLRAGDLGRIIELHGKVYDLLDGYGLRFEAYVGRTIAEFVLDNSAHGQIWLVERGDQLIGCAAIALREGNRGQLRWVVVDPSERGQGIGKQLMQSALDYCRKEARQTVFLDTTDSLPESQALYGKLGFIVTSDTVEELWDGPRPLIVMELSLK